MLRDAELKASVKRVAAFWLTVLFAVVVCLLLVMVLSVVFNATADTLVKQPSYVGGYHDHRL